MADIAISNDGKTNKYVGSICILPGETKIIDDKLVPSRKASTKKPVPKPPTDPVTELLSGKVADIVTALPSLSEDDFVRLAKLEEASEKPRVSLMKAIVAEGIRRAGEKLDGQPEGEAE